MNIVELYGHLLKNNGFTIDKKLKEYDGSGYVVSHKSKNITVQREILNKKLFKSIVETLTRTISESEYVGAWLDVETSTVHFDVNLIYDNIEEAIKEAVRNEQLAIYDITQNREIRVSSLISQPSTI